MKCFSIIVAPYPIASNGAIIGSMLWSENPTGILNLSLSLGIDAIFNDPKHDYTKSLLNAIPIPDPEGREERQQKRKELS